MAVPPPASRARSYSVKSMDGRARRHTCRGAGAGREPGKIVRRRAHALGAVRPHAAPHRSARPAHMEGACLSASFHPPAGTAVHGPPPAAPPHKTSPPRKKSGPAARQPPALHHPAPRRRQKVRPNAALPPSFGRCFCPSLSMAGGSGGGRIARQAATIRAAALLTVSRPAGRFSRMAGAIAAAHAIWREGGAPRAGRTEFPPRIARLNFPHASRVGTHRRVKFLPRVAGGGSGGGRIARQAATIRAAAPLSVSPPAGPARGGRNRRRAYHMAGRGSAPRRQDGVPSAQSRGGANARAARKLPKLGLAKARGAW